MIDEIWPAVGQAWATKLRIFGQGPEFVVLYEHESAPGVERPRMSMAEYIRFEGESVDEHIQRRLSRWTPMILEETSS